MKQAFFYAKKPILFEYDTYIINELIDAKSYFSDDWLNNKKVIIEDYLSTFQNPIWTRYNGLFFWINKTFNISSPLTKISNKSKKTPSSLINHNESYHT